VQRTTMKTTIDGFPTANSAASGKDRRSVCKACISKWNKIDEN